MLCFRTCRVVLPPFLRRKRGSLRLGSDAVDLRWWVWRCFGLGFGPRWCSSGLRPARHGHGRYRARLVEAENERETIRQADEAAKQERVAAEERQQLRLEIQNQLQSNEYASDVLYIVMKQNRKYSC